MPMFVTNLLPASLRGYAKFVWPAILAVLAAVIHGISTGTFRTLEMEIALVGLLAASASFVVANSPVGIQRYAKAIVPAALTVFGVLVHYVVTGDWGAAEWTAAITGLAAAITAFLVPNGLTPLALDALYADEDLPDDQAEFASPPPNEDGEREGVVPTPDSYTASVPIQPSQDEGEARA